MSDDNLDQLIRSAFLQHYVYDKARFDNAHDTTALLLAAEESAKTLEMALTYKLQDRKEEIIQRWIKEQL